MFTPEWRISMVIWVKYKGKKDHLAGTSLLTFLGWLSDPFQRLLVTYMLKLQCNKPKTKRKLQDSTWTNMNCMFEKLRSQLFSWNKKYDLNHSRQIAESPQKEHVGSTRIPAGRPHKNKGQDVRSESQLFQMIDHFRYSSFCIMMDHPQPYCTN